MAKTCLPSWTLLGSLEALQNIQDFSTFILSKDAPGLLKQVVHGENISSNVDLGAACLLAFVQANWTGPHLSESFPDLSREECLEMLFVDGEVVYPLIGYPWLLVLGKSLCGDDKWWTLRALFLWQRLLENTSASLKEQMMAIINVPSEAEERAKLYGAPIFVEAALICQNLNKQKLAEEFLEKTCLATGFKHHMTGILGRKTKFQSFDITQLTVQVENSTCPPQEKSDSLGSPNNIELQDEYILDKAVLNDSSVSLISTIGQAILLAECVHVQKFFAKDVTIVEKAGALITKSLEKKGDWSLYSAALYLRSQLESAKARLIERAALQYQALVDQIKTTDTCVSERMQYIFASPLPPVWEIDRCQALLFAGLGAFRTAGTIYKRREMMEEYITCLIQLGERKEAEELLEIMLKDCKKKVKALCILGDLKNDHEYYIKAWDESKQKSARAMRSLGIWYMRNNQVEKAIEAFERALSMNGLFEKIWFLLGCAAVHVNDLIKALNAFSRVVSLDGEHSDAWNNLASVHLQLGKNEEALSCLKEAGKLQYESWKIWDNIFKVSLMTGDILESISAYRRVAEIREKEVPLDGIHILLNSLSGAVKSFGLQDRMVIVVSRQIAELLDNVMATHLSMKHEFWYACADFCEVMGNRPADYIEFFFKAYRAMQALSVEHDIDAFRTVLTCLERLSAAIGKARNTGDNKDINFEERSYQFKGMVDNILRRTQPNFSDTIEFSKLRTLSA